ncbi:c2h2 type zinc finger protein [Fusarium sporotrichioides]|uniref:C2h2 type zinc finger protein n=1 Tax=Fusarium sporotrichioides TaxID=5514 RepID=A0A395RLA3_FUSSP|nr:c2h2 type zinc finger protein [Fusarium sporotrichioides]
MVVDHGDQIQQEDPGLPAAQAPDYPEPVANLSENCLIPDSLLATSTTSQLDRLAMASIMLSQRGTPTTPPQRLSPMPKSKMDQIVPIQPETLAPATRLPIFDHNTSISPTRHRLGPNPQMARQYLRSQDSGRSGKEQPLQNQDGSDYQSTTMDVDYNIQNTQGVSGFDNIFTHHETEVPTDILDFLHHGTDTDMLNMMIDFSLPLSLSSTAGNHTNSMKDRMSNVPDDRFDLVSRLWPKGWDSRSGNLPTTDLRRDMVLSATSPLESDHDASNTMQSIFDSTQKTQWSIDSLRQQRLWQEFDSHAFQVRRDQQQAHQQDIPSSGHRGSLGADSSSDGGDGAAAFEAGFPSTRILNLGITEALRQPHFLGTFIHRPTFESRKASDLFVFSLCLLGLILLDSGKMKRHVQVYLPAAIRKCCAKLTDLDLRPGGYLLNQATSVNSACDSDQSHDLRWRTWARLEELKRLTSTLFITDAWWSYRLGSTPLTSTSAILYELPCATELFRSPSARSWCRLLASGATIEHPIFVMHLHAPWPRLMTNRDMSPVGILGILSIVWARILDTQWRMIPRQHTGVEHLEDFTTPIDVYATGKLGDVFGPSLQDIYDRQAEFLLKDNPSCIVMWHFLNLQLLVNTELFEIAAGRTNVDDAHFALQLIASWSKTPAARRACLHAAGIYTAMNRRRTHDELMFHSEASMFLAALVLGLYLFMVPRSSEIDDITASTERTMEPWEILDDVDWTRLGLLGFGSHSSNETENAKNEVLGSQAGLFIRQNTPFSFMGTTCEGGYESARMVLLEFAHLMGDLGKGNSDGLGQVLKAMTDSLIDLEDDT